MPNSNRNRTPDALDCGAERQIDQSNQPVSSHAAPLIQTALTGRPLGSGSPGGGRFHDVPVNSRGDRLR